MLHTEGWNKTGLRHLWTFPQLTELSKSTWQARHHLPKAVRKDKGFSERSSLSLHPSLHREVPFPHAQFVLVLLQGGQAAFSEAATKRFTAYCWELQGTVRVTHAPSPPPSWARDTPVVPPPQTSKNLVTC